MGDVQPTTTSSSTPMTRSRPPAGSPSTTRRSGARKKVYHCITCPSSFDRPSSLSQHMLSHTGEKPHACPQCNRRFSTASNAKRHSKTCNSPPIPDGELDSGSVSAVRRPKPRGRAVAAMSVIVEQQQQHPTASSSEGTTPEEDTSPPNGQPYLDDDGGDEDGEGEDEDPQDMLAYRSPGGESNASSAAPSHASSASRAAWAEASSPRAGITPYETDLSRHASGLSFQNHPFPASTPPSAARYSILSEQEHRPEAYSHYHSDQIANSTPRASTYPSPAPSRGVYPEIYTQETVSTSQYQAEYQASSSGTPYVSAPSPGTAYGASSSLQNWMGQGYSNSPISTTHDYRSTPTHSQTYPPPTQWVDRPALRQSVSTGLELQYTYEPDHGIGSARHTMTDSMILPVQHPQETYAENGGYSSSSNSNTFATSPSSTLSYDSPSTTITATPARSRKQSQQHWIPDSLRRVHNASQLSSSPPFAAPPPPVASPVLHFANPQYQSFSAVSAPPPQPAVYRKPTVPLGPVRPSGIPPDFVHQGTAEYSELSGWDAMVPSPLPYEERDSYAPNVPREPYAREVAAAGTYRLPGPALVPEGELGTESGAKRARRFLL